jgi:peptidoglycan/LPS O-acetylase OafA/YrhL
LSEASANLKRFYHPELDALRFVAFFLVFLHHAFSLSADVYSRLGLSPAVATAMVRIIDAGRVGVDLFFVLSSYLITTLLLRERRIRGDFRLSAFYARRALRIWPLYFAVIAFCELALRFVLPGENFPIRYVAAFSLFSGNWAMIAWGLPTSAAAILWSVSIEEQFYILWPLALRRLHGVRVGVAGLVLVLVAMMVRHAIASSTPSVVHLWYNTFARLDTIGAGILLAYFFSDRAPELHPVARISMGVAAAMAILISRVIQLPEEVQFSIATLSCAAVLVAVLFPSGQCPAPLRLPWLLYLGKISYGLYALHMIGIYAMARMMHPHGALSGVLRLGAMFAITLAAAAISYQFLEKPFLTLKERLAVVKRES